MLNIREVVVDPALSDVSIAYRNEAYIADRIFPSKEVATQNGKYYVYDKANLRRNKTLRAAGAKSNEVEFGLSTAAYTCEDHALKDKLPMELLEQADAALDLETDATENVTEMLMVDKEVALATTMANTSTITQNVTLSGTDQWSDFENSDPFDDIRTAISTVQASIGRRPNTLVLGQQVFNKLVDHPDIVDRIKYTSGSSITPEMIARLFDLKQCLIGGAVYNSAVEGQTDSLSYVWGKHAWVCFVPEGTPRLKQIAFGLTLTYGKREVKKWDDEDANARYVRVNDNYTQELVAAAACYLIKNAVA